MKNFIKRTIDRIRRNPLLVKPVVMPRFSVSLVYQNTSNIMLRCLILRAKSKNEALGETIEYYEDETKGYGLVLKTVIQLNEA